MSSTGLSSSFRSVHILFQCQLAGTREEISLDFSLFKTSLGATLKALAGCIFDTPGPGIVLHKQNNQQHDSLPSCVAFLLTITIVINQ